MRHRDFREKKQPLVMIIPMIDIMLFLLVFFMISTIYMVQTNTLQVTLPKAANGAVETRPNVISITVTVSGEVLYEGDTTPNEKLAERIHATLESNSETVFLLRGDKSAKYESVVAILDLLKKSGARHVSIATEQI